MNHEERMQSQPILIVTRDMALWQSWQPLRTGGQAPLRGVSLQDLQQWKASGQQLVILDMELLHEAGNEPRWSQYFEGLRVLVLSAHMSDEEGQRVLAHGACGYAHTHSPITTLALIVESLQSGSIWMGRSLLQKMLQDIDQRLPAPVDNTWSLSLSSREKEVARCAALGQSNAEIAEHLGITERTVRAHLSSVFEKLHVDDRLKLALKVHGIRR